MKAGDQFGPWVLEEDIGGGGNGVVWRVRHAESGDTAAVKFINATKADREPYKRFVLEIETQAGVDDPGVMPVLDYYCPTTRRARTGRGSQCPRRRQWTRRSRASRCRK